MMEHEVRNHPLLYLNKNIHLNTFGYGLDIMVNTWDTDSRFKC